MTSTKISPTLCETTGGGKFVAIPGFKGEMIDRRLLADIRWIKKRYRIFITDGYSMSDVHAEQGEHPIGLALDIVPNKAEGGTWADITALARWAEPQAEPAAGPVSLGRLRRRRGPRPRQPPASLVEPLGDPGRVARAKLVDTIRCPDPIAGQSADRPEHGRLDRGHRAVAQPPRRWADTRARAAA